MTDKQFDAFLRFLLKALKNADAETDADKLHESIRDIT